MQIGIDFGTTNSSVAHFDGTQLHPIRLDPANAENPYVLPSLLYIDRDYQVRVGTAAAEEYLARETGRRIIWERRELGAIEMIVAGGGGPIRYMHEVNVVTDIGMNGRLLQSIKTALRDPTYEGTTIFDRYYTLDELIALILAAMKASAEAQLGEPCESVVLGRPVRFSDDPAISERAEEILYRAARFAGFREITFALEPIAVAHLYHRSTPRRQQALIFDFGGGTLDLTVAEVGGAEPPRVIATRGALVGGDDLDRRIMRSLLKYFGEGTYVEDGHRPFPADYLDALHSWQTMPDLSRPEPLAQLRAYQKQSTNPRALQALETLVTQNLGFQLFRKIERTKKALTPDIFARLDFEHGAITIHERFKRRDFEQLIATELATVEREIRQVLAEAGLRPEQLQVVLRTGGTSLVPAFVELLERLFSPEKVQPLEPLTSVVGGMAVVAQEGEGLRPAYRYRYELPFRNLRAASDRAYEPCLLRARMSPYTDRDYTLVNLPLLLSGLHGIRTADRDYNAKTARALRFDLLRPARVYVIYQAKANYLPEWLHDFRLEPNAPVEIDTAGGRMPFVVYSKEFPAGPVILGGAQARGYSGLVFMNYLVAVRPE